MIPIIIFSHSGLVRLAISKTVNDVVLSADVREIQVEVCCSLLAFWKAMSCLHTDTPRVIFDVDGTTAAEKMTVFHARARLLIFCREDKGSSTFKTFRCFSMLTISKSETMASLKAGVHQLILGARNENEQSVFQASGDILTKREADVLPYLLLNVPDKDIGAVMGLTTKTVNCHRRRIYAKYRVKSPASLREKLDSGTESSS